MGLNTAHLRHLYMGSQNMLSALAASVVGNQTGISIGFFVCRDNNSLTHDNLGTIKLTLSRSHSYDILCKPVKTLVFLHYIYIKCTILNVIKCKHFSYLKVS